jgi:hypothetical protein
MSSVQKIGLAIVGVGAITALTLPGRQSAQVLKAAGGVFQGGLGTAILG